MKKGRLAILVGVLLIIAVISMSLVGCASTTTTTTSTTTTPTTTTTTTTTTQTTTTTTTTTTSTTTPTTTTTTPGEVLKIAVITAGSRTDAAWSQSNYNAYLAVKAQYPTAEVTFIDLVDFPDMENVLATAAQNNDLIGVDSSFFEQMLTVPQQYPNTWWAYWCPTLSEMQTLFTQPNLVGYESRDEDAGFLAGVAAGMLTKTNKIGYVAGQAFPEIIRYGVGFREGAKYVNPNAELSVLYTGSWVDVEKAYESAKALIALGVDVIAHYSDAGGFGVAKAVNEAPGVWFCGEVLGPEQEALAPDRFITSFIVPHPDFMLHFVDSFVQGTIKHTDWVAGVGFDPAYQEQMVFGDTDWSDPMNLIAEIGKNVPADVKAKVVETAAKIKSGEIVVPFKELEEDLKPLY